MNNTTEQEQRRLTLGNDENGGYVNTHLAPTVDPADDTYAIKQGLWFVTQVYISACDMSML